MSRLSAYSSPAGYSLMHQRSLRISHEELRKSEVGGPVLTVCGSWLAGFYAKSYRRVIHTCGAGSRVLSPDEKGSRAQTLNCSTQPSRIVFFFTQGLPPLVLLGLD